MENSVKSRIQTIFRKISLLSIAGLLIGAIGGYIYYLKVGCVTGTCAITSNPWLSALWGAAFGYLIFDMFRGKKVKSAPDRQNEQ